MNDEHEAAKSGAPDHANGDASDPAENGTALGQTTPSSQDFSVSDTDGEPDTEEGPGAPFAMSGGAEAQPAAAERPAMAPLILFQPPVLFAEPITTPSAGDDDDEEIAPAPRRRTRARARPSEEPIEAAEAPADEDEDEPEASSDTAEDSDADDDSSRRRRRRRGGRGRRVRGERDTGDDSAEDPGEEQAEDDAHSSGRNTRSDAGPAGGDSEIIDEEMSAGGTRRRRRGGGTSADDLEPSPDDPPQTVVRVREPRRRSDRFDELEAGDAKGIRGSTRLEAKKQRRREGREQGRRRVPIISEAEFLARRESVERVMVVRQSGERTQIGVLEDGILVEHYVTRASATSYVGNVYLGRVQNVLPSMEAAFVDIGKGRNGVLYAGEVNWDAAGLDGQPKRIELALKAGDSVLVQVTKDPIGHKGARLTSQVSLPGRFLVYVPDGAMTGISRKLPDTERNRLKSILRSVLPEEAGVIVRTAAEGASEEELARDVARLQSQWDDIAATVKTASAPALLHSEPDLTTRVIRDIFNEDFAKLVVSGDNAWSAVAPYVEHLAPDLLDRLEHWTAGEDVFAAHRIDEQLAKALDRKVWLPSGGSLVIDRTEAMIVVDVNTGKFTGKGGNLEETVTKNNLEAAEEIVRQLRLRDLGGIIVIDFIDMVLESNRELVLRRLLECLGRDRTKHQVAEVTSLGLVQMTRKRVGQGLLEAFSEPCDTCSGSGVILSTDAAGRPVGTSGERPEAPAPRPVVSGLPPAVLARMPVPRAAVAESTDSEPAAPAPKPRRGRRAARTEAVVSAPAPVEQGAEAPAGSAEAVASAPDSGTTDVTMPAAADVVAQNRPAAVAEAQAASGGVPEAQPAAVAASPGSPGGGVALAAPAEATADTVAVAQPPAVRQRRPRRATRPAGAASGGPAGGEGES